MTAALTVNILRTLPVICLYPLPFPPLELAFMQHCYVNHYHRTIVIVIIIAVVPLQ